MPLTAERLREVLTYNPETGLWEWLPRIGNVWFAGRPAGSLSPDGYVYLTIDGTQYSSHRLAWLYMTGSWPVRRLDHEDTVRSNNRWGNLRLATHRQNLANAKVSKANRLGVKGVTRCNSKARPFRARIYVNKRLVTIGYYATEVEANAAYFVRAQQARGEFARAG